MLCVRHTEAGEVEPDTVKIHKCEVSGMCILRQERAGQNWDQAGEACDTAVVDAGEVESP